MASRNFVVALFTVAVLIANAMATEYLVGDSTGWTIDFDYQAWASNKVFTVGDTLVFNYPKGIHNVFKVNGTGFKECIIPAANLALASGRDVITLATPGKKWYICGVAAHCAEHNQKLVINVVDGWSAPAPSPIPSTPPAASPTPNTPTTPPTSSAHGTVMSKYQIFVTSVVALALFFMY